MTPIVGVDVDDEADVAVFILGAIEAEADVVEMTVELCDRFRL